MEARPPCFSRISTYQRCLENSKRKMAIGSQYSILKSNECWTSAWFTPSPTTGWWRHFFGHLYNRNHRADDVFSAFSSVYCVRFSADGEYLTTAFRNAAQIYDTKTGAKIWFGPFLVDGTPGSDTIIAAVSWSIQLRTAPFGAYLSAQMANCSQPAPGTGWSE